MSLGQNSGCASCLPEPSKEGLAFFDGVFVPRWDCGTWPTMLGWTHIASDLFTWLAYTAIPILLFILLRRRKAEIPKPGLLILFSLFILACGTGHLVEAIIFWKPIYGLAGLVKMATAAVSVLTVCALTRALPSLLELRTPSQLEKEVENRTQQLLQSQSELERARKKAEKADQAKSVFLATMSHELRTPLAAILGGLELIHEESEAGEAAQPELLHTIRRNAEHQLALINDVLDLSKVESGSLELMPSPFVVGDLLQETIDLFCIRARDKGISLHIDRACSDVIVTDRIRVKQVLVNLVSNALKFTDRGSVSIGTEIGRESQNGVCFWVSDTGIGMDAEQLGRVFEPYCQAEATTHIQHGGTGLGLSISRGIAHALGGDLIATSAPRRGSTFYLRIKAEVMTAGHQPAFSDSKDHDLRGKRVLLAEDQRDLALVTTRSLEAAGCRVTHASDGRQAIDRFETDTFDIVILDLQMPEVSGMEVASHIRERGWSGPILALTANAFVEDATMSRHYAHFTAFCTKPIPRAALVSVVASSIQVTRSA